MAYPVLLIPDVSAVDDEQRLQWCVYDNLLVEQNQSGGWHEFCDWYKQGEFVGLTVLCAGKELYQTAVKIPSTNTKQLLKALPFLVEEQLASNVENMHLATGKLNNGDLPLTIIHQNHMQFWVQRFEEAGVNLLACYFAADLVAVADDQLNLVQVGSAVLIKTKFLAVFVAVESLSAFLSTLNMDGINTIKVCLKDKVEADPDSKQVLECAKNLVLEYAGETEIKIEQEKSDGELFSCLNQPFFTQSENMNLLQGEFSSSSQQFAWQTYVKPLAMTVVLCVFIQLSVLLCSGFYFENRTGKYELKTVELFNKWLPEKNATRNNLSDVIEDSSRGVRGNVGRSDFSRIFAQAIAVLQDFKQGDQGSALEIDQFSFKQKSGELKLELLAAAITQIDAFKSALEGKNLNAKLLSANERNGKINATLVLTY